MNDITDAADFIVSERQNARSSMVGLIEADPEKAARAMQLEQATGVPSPVIHSDLEQFEANHKSMLASQLLRNNHYLTEYINSHPLAAQVSNDDFGQLDTISNSVSKFGWDIGKAPRGVLDKAFHGFKEGLELDRSLGEGMMGPPSSASDLEFKKNYPLLYQELVGVARAGAEVLDVGSRAISSVSQAFGEGAAEAYRQVTGDEASAKRVARDFRGMVEQYIMGLSGVHKTGMAEIPKNVTDAIRASKPYLDAGIEPPVGVHPVIDQIKSEQAKLDAENLSQALKDSRASATRERNPQLFSNFIRQHTEAKIGISYDAVRELYGEKQPHSEDGLLGWIPDINEQLRTAEATGGDVTVSLADWLARVEPGVASKLHDDLRVRQGGLTVNEGKELPKLEVSKADEVVDTKFAEDKQPEVEAVRSQAALKPLFEEGGKALEAASREGKMVPVSQIVDVLTPKEFTKNELEIHSAVSEVLDKIVSKAVDVYPTPKIDVKGRKPDSVRGVYTQYKDRLPLIVYALTADDPIAIARHEAIHHLRAYGFFNEAEWSTLKDAAVKEDWINKQRPGEKKVADRYKGLDEESRLEEAIADEFAYWKRHPDEPTLAAKVFEKLRELLSKIKEVLEGLRSKNPAVEAIFAKVESGEIGSREGTKPRLPEVFDKFSEQGELDVTRQEDKAIFEKAKDVGMTVERYKRSKALMDQQRIEYAEYLKSKATREAKRRLTKEWKENEARVRDEVRSDIETRPDIVVGDFFINGMLFGDKLEHKPKLRSDALTEEQRKALPSGITAVDGMHPDEVAHTFGYQSGKVMIDKFIELNQARGAMSPREFMEAIVRDETERRMQREYGDLAENIISEAEDHVFGSNQMDQLHEQTVSMGMKAGSEITFTRQDIQNWISTKFADLLADEVKASRFIADTGRAGRVMDLARTKGDHIEAFKQAQRQEWAAQFVIEAKKFEKEKAKGDRLISRYVHTVNIESVAQPYTDQIHRLLNQVEIGTKRTSENLDKSIRNVPLSKFIESENAKGAGILDPQLPNKRSFEEFTVDEYRDFVAAVESLDYNGKLAKKIEVRGKKEAYEEVIGNIANNLDALEKKNFDPTKTGTIAFARHLVREVDARLIKTEQLADWIDKNDPNGEFNSAVVRKLFAAQHKRTDVITELAADIKRIPVDRAWGRALTDVIDNRFLKDVNGNPELLTNENKIVIALNYGNKSNRSVLTRGKGWTEQDVQAFLDAHMTKMDWDFVKGIWGVFDKIGPYVEEATTKRSGVSINMIEPLETKTPFGMVDGGYYPLIKDPRAALLSQQVKTDLVDKPFFDPLPMARAMKLRTGIAYPLDLSLNSLNSRINETLHAALFQDPVRNARKVLNDPIVREGVDKAFGPEYVHQLDVWLDDIANNGGMNSDALASWISRNMRENLVYGLMGYKISTAVIHGGSAGVASIYEQGVGSLSRGIKDLGIAQIMPDVARRFFANEKNMWETVDWANKTFPELRNRMRDIERDFGAQLSNIVKKGFIDDAARIRAVNIVWSMKMVATLDQLTATPVAMSAYRKATGNGISHDDAVYAADKAVRQAHGSPSLVSRANVGRGEVGRWLTIAYNGYWNHNYNRTRSAVRDIKAPDIDFSDRLIIGSAALTALVIAPALIHYAVRGSQNETWTGAAAEAIASQFGGQVPIVNSLTYSFMHTRDPHVSPLDALFGKVAAIAKDTKQMANGHKADKFLKHVVETPGYLFGIGASDQIGTAMQFNKDVFSQKERPKSILEWARGEVTGHAQQQKHKRGR